MVFNQKGRQIQPAFFLWPDALMPDALMPDALMPDYLFLFCSKKILLLLC
jgi:hypothetical protein